MVEAVEYALATALLGVAQTIRWLQSVGFGLVGELGESFGNVLLEFEHGGQRVVIVRDRAQWVVNIAPSGSGEPCGLQVLLWTVTRGEPGLDPRDE